MRCVTGPPAVPETCSHDVQLVPLWVLHTHDGLQRRLATGAPIVARPSLLIDGLAHSC